MTASAGVVEPRKPLSQAELILEDIAAEYAAKRAAGLVPMKPVPARALLWEEMARQKSRSGSRKGCLFGRDDAVKCGCTSYCQSYTDKGSILCVQCGHGAPWHKIVGGERVLDMVSIVESMNLDEDYDSQVDSLYSEFGSEISDDDEDISNEVARPYHLHPNNSSSFGMSSFGRPSALKSGGGRTSDLSRLLSLEGSGHDEIADALLRGMAQSNGKSSSYSNVSQL
ncbi:hypothetical protein DYB28_005165 [Aphanomyces astaci]|uniref:Uncharacterized protein n=1 Tax=Aphanomyces astaci TaxID=112090 RepID=A0A397E7N7_APHAT|nr:hypothetical protein AaE_015255 [Aphanomyces astaci]RHY02676.1 hypothetical protein DYB36_008243 [Aphanomyces astaci]RHY23031.1 hypothetical protein DYB25_007106 [Aphanomyces astaci]RHY67425.1 hypothetical protein DYB30_008385 [Aphanomyces astaci]RHY67748.1 hypothetical protein DYB34_007668 [Aphanomyces astaci]